MENVNLTYNELKKLIKESLAETFIENREMIHNIVVEAIEDIALVESIKEGRDTELISEEEIYSILDK